MKFMLKHERPDKTISKLHTFAFCSKRLSSTSVTIRSSFKIILILESFCFMLKTGLFFLGFTKEKTAIITERASVVMGTFVE